MMEQRLQQRLRFLLVAPAILITLVAAIALTTAHRPGEMPREAIFDLFARLEPRPTPDRVNTAIIDIDQESLERIGPWPWPRTAIADLVTTAKEAGATSVVVTIPMEGPDPLSPQILARYWENANDGGSAYRAMSQLPTNNAALSAAATAIPTALGVGRPMTAPQKWARAEMTGLPWIRFLPVTEEGASNPDILALPRAPLLQDIDPGFIETSLVAVATLPLDQDQRVRRAPLLWSLNDQPAPTAGLAGLLANDPSLAVRPTQRSLSVGGPPLAAFSYGDGPLLPLSRQGGIPLWLPQTLDIPAVPAWRALEGGETWTRPLNNRVVFIGNSTGPQSSLMTSRGELSKAALHAQFSEQIRLGLIPHRPAWAGPLEAGLALLLGVFCVFAAIYFRPLLAGTVSIGLSLGALVTTFLLFQEAQLLIDPAPMMMASLGGQLAILGSVVGNMLFRDDAIRGAFHGALPASTMIKLQAGAGGNFLRGVRRQITVLSCRLRLPPKIVQDFEGRPDDFIRFVASANDALRRTILSHGGTVDFGEDGRLLAYWNVPEPSDKPIEKACACALKMIDDMNTLSENVQSSAFAGADTDEDFADSSIEIGLASALSFAGPVGRGSRNRYAVLGEAVKLACALRARAPQYGPAIITDDIVFDALRHHYAFLDLDIIRTAEDHPVRTVYGLVGNPFLKASKAFRQLADTQRELVQSWKDGELAATTLQLQRLRGIPGVPDAYIDLYEERLNRARGNEELAKSTAELLTL